MSASRRPGFAPRVVWTPEDLEADRQAAIAAFRQSRMAEPLEQYLNHFTEAELIMTALLSETADLRALEERAVKLLTNARLLEGFRYLTGPPISLDDLKTLADTNSLTQRTLANDPELLQRLVDTVRTGLDRRRFPWVAEQRTPSGEERQAAVLATAALLATRRTETARRSEAKQDQEALVHQALRAVGFVETTIPGGIIRTISGGPRSGEFSREVILGERKADVVAGLWDDRLMPIECKVSNSAINSVKRLNNDAAAKADAWISDFGERHVVPSATLSGVYKLHNLLQAQDRGLTLYWAHRLSDLTDWIERTRGA